ncbi:MAG TPA: hypothetical protein VIF62_11060 [Labilithrix sp.]|jgi:hypothetical protein
MRGLLRLAIVILPLGAAAWGAGCHHKTDEVDDTVEAGPDAPTADPPPPPAETSTARDCSMDQQADGLYGHLECTGLYSDFAQKTIASGVRPYVPGLQFWSDGAEKARFLRLPAGAKIDTSNFDEWHWPNGTTVWKEFQVGGKRVETRIYTKSTNGTWLRTTYRWNGTETDAVRKDAGEKVPQAGKPDYEIPAAGYCDQCHQGRADALLGLEPVSLGLASAQGVTLASLAAEGLLSNPPPQTTFAIPEDPALDAGLASSALGWLHVNCGACHNDSLNATAQYTNLFFLIKASQIAADGGASAATGLDAYLDAVCQKSKDRTIPDSGPPLVPWTLVAGGDPDASYVSILSAARAQPPDDPNVQNQMPPIITHAPDDVGHARLDDWIRALAPCP